jgi:hypothetical protein
MGRYDNWGVLDDMLLNLAFFSPLLSSKLRNVFPPLSSIPFLSSLLFSSLSSFLLPPSLTPLLPSSPRSALYPLLLLPLFSFFPPPPLQSPDTVHDTQWLFPRDRVRGRGRAYADENPPDSSPSFDGVQRVWKKSDPATTGVYGPRSLVDA